MTTNTQGYTISQMSSISKISKKALRFYDDLGLIASKRHGGNNYRYYTHDDLLAVPPLKYYKQMGFHLAEIRTAFEVGGNTSLSALRKLFLKKIQALHHEERILHLRLTSVHDWLELLHEAEMVLENDTQTVSVKYLQPESVLFHDQNYREDIKSSIINIDFTNYVESIKNNITGPVMILFSSMERRRQHQEQPVKILQRTVFPCEDALTTTWGGFLVLSCYHIGAHDSISETYGKIARWAKANNYVLDSGCCERYVTDYWTTNNDALFVTEVLVRAARRGAPLAHADSTGPQRTWLGQDA